jgi:hypothetical protein
MAIVDYTPEEFKIAQTIYRALRRQQRDACVLGAPHEVELTLIDGAFDLRRVARKLVQTIQADCLFS